MKLSALPGDVQGWLLSPGPFLGQEQEEEDGATWTQVVLFHLQAPASRLHPNLLPSLDAIGDYPNSPFLLGLAGSCAAAKPLGA